MLIPKEKPPITVVGDAGGRIAIIVVRAPLLSLLVVIFTLVSLSAHLVNRAGDGAMAR